MHKKVDMSRVKIVPWWKLVVDPRRWFMRINGWIIPYCWIQDHPLTTATICKYLRPSIYACVLFYMNVYIMYMYVLCMHNTYVLVSLDVWYVMPPIATGCLSCTLPLGQGSTAIDSPEVRETSCVVSLHKELPSWIGWMVEGNRFANRFLLFPITDLWWLIYIYIEKDDTCAACLLNLTQSYSILLIHLLSAAKWKGQDSNSSPANDTLILVLSLYCWIYSYSL